MKKRMQWLGALIFAALVCVTGTQGQQTTPPQKPANSQICCGPQKQTALSKKATAKFAARAEVLLGTGPTGKGAWGLLIVDAETGEALFQQNAERYFVPASNMKLFATALALAKLGPEFRFHTTLETNGTISGSVLTGDLVLVGRGDPNL